jgi:2-dehydro-3-deoxyphosphogluconate aldolase/(4S)-4-hydroxy-2-oxoglutarate aldolase
MKITNIRETVKKNPVLAILRGVSTDMLIDYVGAIKDGGVRFFEVALNTPDALVQIKMLKARFGDEIIVGAGTAITVKRAKAAVKAGADFLLAPSADEPVLKWCKRNGVAMLPGVLTPTDVSLSLKYGFDTLKLFPASDMPLSYVKSLKGPFDTTEYIAIGGISHTNASDFINAGCIGVGLGSNIAPKEAIKARDCKSITEAVKNLVSEVTKK